MKIIIEAEEVLDFPPIDFSKRKDFEDKTEKSLRERLELRKQDMIIIQNKYLD